MDKKITITEFNEKGAALLERLEILQELFEEASNLLESVDAEINEDEATDEQVDEYYVAQDLAYEIARAGNWVFNGLGEELWLPSTC